MMKDVIFTVRSNEMIAKNTYEMILSGDTEGLRAGGFVNLKLDGFYLRRPISVCDYEGDTLTLIYKVVGKGTEQMARMTAGQTLDVLTGLGNGYDLSKAGDKPLLIGGGVGLPPMIGLCRTLLEEGKHPTVLAGFNTAEEVFLMDTVEQMGATALLATMDGSAGVKGLVTDAMKDVEYSYFYTCGPEPMLKAVWSASTTEGQFSFEERMGCGFGACMGCSCKTLTGNKRICKEGPVLRKEEILWQK